MRTISLTSNQRERLQSLLKGPSHLADEPKGRHWARAWWNTFKSLERRGLAQHPKDRHGYARTLSYELTEAGRVEASR